MSVHVLNLTKKYGSQLAVDSISFEIKRGEITGFIGPNGSGKSTTMKSICGAHAFDDGEILIDGISISSANHRIKRKIGYLPENNPLYYDQYVAEYLTYTGQLYKIGNLKKRVKEIIGLTGLEPEKKKKIGQLSKGYKQRVGLAQALIHDPEILILDEPTTGLDPNQIVEIRNLIRDFSKEKTVLLSTHILQEVEAICDRVIMINKGKIVANETTDNVKLGGAEKQTVFVEFKEEPDENLLFQIAKDIKIKSMNKNQWLIESAVKTDIRELIFLFAKENNLSILELQTRKRTLEETFRDLSS